MIILSSRKLNCWYGLTLLFFFDIHVRWRFIFMVNQIYFPKYPSLGTGSKYFWSLLWSIGKLEGARMFVAFPWFIGILINASAYKSTLITWSPTRRACAFFFGVFAIDFSSNYLSLSDKTVLRFLVPLGTGLGFAVSRFFLERDLLKWSHQ